MLQRLLNLGDTRPGLLMILRYITTLIFVVAAVVFYAPGVQASALTTTVGPNEKLCFYADVDKEGEKIGVSIILFAVHAHYLSLTL